MYSSTMTSRIASSSFEDGEALAITMAHLGLLFHLLGVDYNLISKLMLQEPYDSLGVTYYQALQVSFGNGTLVSSKFKSEEKPSLYYQCISVVLHGPRIHHVVVHIPELVEHSPILPKKKIPPDILILFGVYTDFGFSVISIFEGRFCPMRFSSLPLLHGSIKFVVKGDLCLSFQGFNKSC